LATWFSVKKIRGKNLFAPRSPPLNAMGMKLVYNSQFVVISTSITQHFYVYSYISQQNFEDDALHKKAKNAMK